MSTPDKTFIVIRHNVDMTGDFLLAMRELCALAGQSGTWIKTSDEFQFEVGLDSVTRRVILPQSAPDSGGVAVLFAHLPIDRIKQIVTRSAFGQEVICLGEPGLLEEVQSSLPTASALSMQFDGSVLISLTINYIVESEGVLNGTSDADRLASVEELLLEPFRHSRASATSGRLRRAKKTTLSLTHDLHIYKAKFFPRMVRSLLNIYASEGDVVVDPFCGSGTALLEGALLGFQTHGIDVDPICTRISDSKITPFVHSEATAAELGQFQEAIQASDDDKCVVGAIDFPEELHGKLERRDKKHGTNFLPEILRETNVLANAVNGLNGASTPLVQTIASDAVTKKIRYRFVGVGNGRYTIEVVKQSLLDRSKAKITRLQELIDVFSGLESRYGLNIISPVVNLGDARISDTWKVPSANVIVTSPPYLPASSGREHYAASRALAFHILGEEVQGGYLDTELELHSEHEAFLAELLAACPESKKLMDYLYSDATDNPNPQRDAMRFERKAKPTARYLIDLAAFFQSAANVLAPGGVLLLVVAHHHTFYSHRRNELEHIVSGRYLYTEIAALAGFRLEEELDMELQKSAVSRARPRARERYFESILVLLPT